MILPCVTAGGGGDGPGMAVPGRVNNVNNVNNVGPNGIDGHLSVTGACRGWSVGPVIKPTAENLPQYQQKPQPKLGTRNRRDHGNGISEKTVVDCGKVPLTCNGKDDAGVVERHDRFVCNRNRQAKHVVPLHGDVLDAGSIPAGSTIWDW